MKILQYLLILIFSLISTHSLAIPRCEELLETIYNDEIRKDVNIRSVENQKTIGIRLEKYWKKWEDDESSVSGNWDLSTNKDGYFVVGKVTKGNLSEEIKVGDIVLSINDLDLREIAKDKEKKKIMKSDISDLFEENELIKFKLLRPNKKTKREEIIIVDRSYEISEKPNIENTLETYNEPSVDFYINSISIDEKEGFFNASIETNFQEVFDERFFLTKAIWGTIVYDKEYEDSKLKNAWYERCLFSNEEWQKLNTKDPLYGLKFDNLIKEDVGNRTSRYHIRPLFEKIDYDDDFNILEIPETEAEVIYKSTSFYKIRNYFNLKTFPFDKQKISVYLRNDINSIDDYRSLVSSFTMKRALEFKNSNSIPGWDIKNVNMKYHIYDDPNDNKYKDGFMLEFEVERKSRYYIFKIIFPIILILSVCWSAVWIHPREIETRVTITVVCFLSLIAYNFVIDSELPKLEYLTIMDYVILVSYIYATIPNFLSIFAFTIFKKNKKLSEKYEGYGRKFGLLSYLLIVFFIVIVNSHLSPEHTNSMLTW